MVQKLYIDDYVGLANRLETLALAFAIRKEFGHDIILDWPELDSFRVDETRRGRVRIVARLGAIRIRYCDGDVFGGLAGKKIILRALDGPRDRLDPIYLDVASRVRPLPPIVEKIRGRFAEFRGRPVVGVHLRRGDFACVSEARYDATAVEWPAVPLWWYERTMEAIARREKNVAFFLAATGNPGEYSSLARKFDVFTLDVPTPYLYKGPGNQSKVHPVADLFALACCPTILATPISGYSHWAANVLGEPTVSLVPLDGATRDDPRTGKLALHGKRLPEWRLAGREGRHVRPVPGDLDGLDLSRPARTDWLRGAR